MRSALPVFPSPKWWPLRSGLCHFTIMALTLADRGEKLHSETLFLYFCCTFSKHQRISREINANTNSSVLISYLEADSIASMV